MESLTLKAFVILFRAIGILLMTGAIVAVLADLQNDALNSRRHGLVSMLFVNQQLVGKTQWLPKR